jgi:hypothetical protein
LGALRDANFVDMACDQSSTGYTYVITEHGILCAFKEGRVIDKWVDLQVFIYIYIYYLFVVVVECLYKSKYLGEKCIFNRNLLEIHYL